MTSPACRFILPFVTGSIMATFPRSRIALVAVMAACWLCIAPGGAAGGEAGGPVRVMPQRDPPPDRPLLSYRSQIRGRHPRLLITPDRIPALRAFAASPLGRRYREQIARLLPACKVPADRMTSHAWGQEAGLQRMPTVALDYVLTGDKTAFSQCMAYLTWLDSLPDWTTNGEGHGSEVDSDTAAAFTMVGASLMWDWLYNDLQPDFRERFRKDLWFHARAMYYGGHLGYNSGGAYWRGVPAYNHRWFRGAGLALATFAAADGTPDQAWLLARVQEELGFMVRWMPPDGSEHEGPNYGGAIGLLGMACQACDTCFGSRLLDAPAFRNLGLYGLDLAAPGTLGLCFGDCWYARKPGSVNTFLLRTAAYYHQADIIDGVRRSLLAAPADENGWSSMLFDDPTLQGGDYHRLPVTAFIPDLGITIVRESWKPTSVIAMFSCGPRGGYDIQGWRTEMAKNGKGLPYINIAHEHPDANSFVLLGDGAYLAETDRYPEKPGKLSSSCNTILVNGVGQVPSGRKEGDVWLQPSYQDMTSMGRIVAWKQTHDVVVAEGEASGSYLAYADASRHLVRPALDRYRRTCIWVTGSYVLILDDIRAPRPVDITWLVQGVSLTATDPLHGRYRLSNGSATCDFQVLSDGGLTSHIGVSTANDHGRLLHWQQLQAHATTAAIRFGSVYDLWHHRGLKISLRAISRDHSIVTVTGAGIDDTWDWTAGPTTFATGVLHGSRVGGFDIVVDGHAVPPAAPGPPRSGP